jgi:hypothetical protein
VLFCLLSHWCCLVYQSKPLVSLLLFYLVFRSTLGYWCCFVCCLTGAVWSTNHSPLSRCCCFIYPFEAPWGTGVVLSVVSLVLFGLPIKAPCLAVVVLSSLSKHLEVLVLFYLPFRSTLGYWCCFIYPFEAPWGTGVVLSVVSVVLSILLVWFSFIFPLEILYLYGTVLSTLTKHIVSQVLLNQPFTSILYCSI